MSVLLTDRTSIETDWTCGMKRWWYKEEGGTGIVPATEPAYFAQGRALHELLDKIALADDPRSVLECCLPPAAEDNILKWEEWARLLGWLTAFVEWVEIPDRAAGWRTLKTEHELILDRDPLMIACTPDRISQHTPSGRVRYWEYKTTGAFDLVKWSDYWPHAVQLHIGLQAMKEEMRLSDEAHVFGQVVGFAKGFDKDGKLRHPYVWGWFKGDPDMGGVWLREWVNTSPRPWLRPTWEYPGGPAEWVRFLGEETARDVIPLSRHVFVDQRMVDLVVSERTERERLVQSIRDRCLTDRDLRTRVFPMHLGTCRPMIGAPCAYLSACWNASVNADPLASGEFVRREPHHAIEIAMKGTQR